MGAIRELAEKFWAGAVDPREFWKPTGQSEELAPGLVQTARGDDGTVEAVETSDGLIVAVQCHPEELTTDLPWARTLFERFVDRARRRSKS